MSAPLELSTASLSTWDHLCEFLGYAPDLLERLPENNNNGFSFNDPRLIERYMDGLLYIVVHYRAGDQGEFGACFHRKPRLLLPSMGSLYSAPLSQPHYEKSAMLIHNVELVEPPESITSAFVWSKTVDRAFELLPHSVYLSMSLGLVFRGGIKDWKLVAGSSAGNKLYPRGCGQRARDVVESGSEILENVTANERDVIRQRPLDFNAAHNHVASLRVRIGPDYAGAIVNESAQRRMQIVDVVVGPLDF